MFSVRNKFILLLMGITVLFTTLGFTDDYLKWSEKDKKGLSPKKKIAGQILIGLIVWFFVYKFGVVDGKTVDY